MRSDRFGLRALPGWWRSDLSLAGPLLLQGSTGARRRSGWRLNASILDLFNQGGADFVQQPLPGRRFWLTVSYQHAPSSIVEASEEE